MGDRDEAARINGSVGWTAAIAARPLQVDMDRVRIAEWLC
ncbi:hypothetical protein A176_005209 [Myxococcus hansupus]|uniref:Uncharacterized protein n=1 Tax=Pseudomyxococcus hansupus TaxID=1297742 RepID=A0A0H4XJ50_9BACT|nr:hypothetical protein A176_005209 [Myxococcus hansupus]